MRRNAFRLAAVAVVVAGAIVAVLYVGALFPGYSDMFRYLYAALILVAGVVLTREVGLLFS